MSIVPHALERDGKRCTILATAGDGRTFEIDPMNWHREIGVWRDDYDDPHYYSASDPLLSTVGGDRVEPIGDTGRVRITVAATCEILEATLNIPGDEMSTDNEPKEVGGIRGIDHENINGLVDTFTAVGNVILGCLGQVRERGIAVDYYPLGTLTIRIAERPKGNDA